MKIFFCNFCWWLWFFLFVLFCPCTHTHTTVLRPFFRDHPGELVPEENFWTLWCKGRLTEADTPTIRLGAIPSGLASAHLHHPPDIFYRPDAPPATQPTVSKHWRQLFVHASKFISDKDVCNSVIGHQFRGGAALSVWCWCCISVCWKHLCTRELYNTAMFKILGIGVIEAVWNRLSNVVLKTLYMLYLGTF